MEREADVSGILSQTIDVLGAAGRAVVIYVLVLGVLNGLGGLFGLASLDDNFFTARISDGMFQPATAGLYSSLFELGAHFVAHLGQLQGIIHHLLRQLGRHFQLAVAELAELFHTLDFSGSTRTLETSLGIALGGVHLIIGNLAHMVEHCRFVGGPCRRADGARL